MAVYLIAAGTMVLMTFLLSGLVAQAREKVRNRMKTITPTVKYSGGIILMMVGIYLIFLSVFHSYFATVFPV